MVHLPVTGSMDMVFVFNVICPPETGSPSGKN